MIVHVLDYDKGDTCRKISQLSTGLSITIPSGHPKLFADTHQKMMQSACVLLIKVPRIQQITCVQYANLEKKWPKLPKLYVVRIFDSQQWLFPSCNIYSEELLANSLHFVDTIHTVIESGS